MVGVPPRPPYSVGHWMPQKPASAFLASQSRRIWNCSLSLLGRHHSRVRISAGRFLSSQLRSSDRKSSSSLLNARSTVSSVTPKPNRVLLWHTRPVTLDATLALATDLAREAGA